MQVLFHLQTRQPAVLPPVCELFGLAPGNDAIRPLHDRRPPDMALLKVIGPAQGPQAAAVSVTRRGCKDVYLSCSKNHCFLPLPCLCAPSPRTGMPG